MVRSRRRTLAICAAGVGQAGVCPRDAGIPARAPSALCRFPKNGHDR
jgi:hypothetical protein